MSEPTREMTTGEKARYIIDIIEHVKNPMLMYQWEKDFVKSALEKTSDKDCSKCRNKNKCALFDNFNINYCSDWSDSK